MTDERKNQNLNAYDFIGPVYLTKEDITEPKTVTIEKIWSDRFKDSPKAKLVIQFRETRKPLILNTDNTTWLIQHFGTPSTALWRGSVTLYNDPSVMFGGRPVGGIRMRPAQTTAYPNGAPADGRIREHEADVY